MNFYKMDYYTPVLFLFPCRHNNKEIRLYCTPGKWAYVCIAVFTSAARERIRFSAVRRRGRCRTGEWTDRRESRPGRSRRSACRTRRACSGRRPWARWGSSPRWCRLCLRWSGWAMCRPRSQWCRRHSAGRTERKGSHRLRKKEGRCARISRNFAEYGYRMSLSSFLFNFTWSELCGAWYRELRGDYSLQL